jgi:shikimate kinase
MSGKSTIGKILARKLNCNFIDTDHLIEKAYHAKTRKKFSCRQIFLHEGERIFRKLEKQQIASLKGIKKTVISLGGGSLIEQSNIRVLHLLGQIIYLKVSTDIVWKRMQIYGIPPYIDPLNPENAFYALAEKRTFLYNKISNIIIEINLLTEEEIVTSILEKISYG